MVHNILTDTIKRHRSAYYALKRATGYGGTLLYGNYGDSSDESKFRMQFVEAAEAKFIADNKRLILDIAAEICRKCLTDNGIELGEIDEDPKRSDPYPE